MKKIILFILATLLLTSCFGGEDKKDVVIKTTETKVEKNNISNKIVKLENLVNNQKFDEAIPELEKLYNSNSNEIGNILNYMSALLAKGSITRQEKEYSKKAIEVGDKALIIFPNNSELYRTIGYAYEIAEDYDNAFKNYDKSIEINLNNALAYSNRGHAYKLFGDYNRAEKDLLKAYELDKTNDHILINLAGIYVLKGESDKAIDFFNKVIETSKNTRFKSEASYSVGNLLIDKKDYKLAEESFNKSIKLDTKFELGYLGLSKVQFINIIKNSKDKDIKTISKLIDDSIKNNDIGIALNPTRALGYYQRGFMEKDLRMGNSYEIGLTFRAALAVIPNDITLTKIEKKSMIDYINKNK